MAANRHRNRLFRGRQRTLRAQFIPRQRALSDRRAANHKTTCRGVDLDASLIWAEIDLKAIAHNVAELRRITQPDARLMAVVKANGYGHGAVEVARCALQNGATVLGVARIEEGIQIRKAGVKVPILVFGYTLPEQAADLLQYNLSQSVYTTESARKLSRAAASLADKTSAGSHCSSPIPKFLRLSNLGY